VWVWAWGRVNATAIQRRHSHSVAACLAA
jgi:hypothetical protein